MHHFFSYFNAYFRMLFRLSMNVAAGGRGLCLIVLV